MIDFLEILFIIVQFIIGFNLIFPFLLLLYWSVFKKRVKPEETTIEKDFAVIITAYEQTDLIPMVVKSVLEANYSNYIIYVVADNCKYSEELNFNNKKVVVLYPNHVIASNTGSHFFAINNFLRPHEALMILDSDNLVDKNILKELNSFLSNGFDAVQGIRAAKNLDTTISCLDAARDIYYHYYDGKLLFESGSSATLSGSGMAFKVSVYKEYLGELSIKGAGFDKVLQYLIVKNKKRIAFAEYAIVYDQKTSQSDQLVNQRSRWINTWFRYFKFGFDLLFSGILKLNINQTMFGLVLLRPPLFLFLLCSCLFLTINLFISALSSIIWLFALLIFVATFFLSLVLSTTDKKIYKALYSIPLFIYFQLISLLNIRGANKRSIATKHINYQDKEN